MGSAGIISGAIVIIVVCTVGKLKAAVIHAFSNGGAMITSGRSASSIVSVGVTDVRKIVKPESLAPMLRAYNDALMDVFKVPLALVYSSLVGTLAMEWRSVK